jgi:tRNA/tmRNA/rRNA uracil-C5-methylase (TrmA/RlmC/RlmD family)
VTVVGERIPVRARNVAHGGAMLAERLDGQARATVFLRHALPGEEGEAEVTAVRRGGRIIFADLVSLAAPSPDRVAPPCPYARPRGCGGCDFQHVALPAQRRLKADVVRDCLRRIGRFAPPEVPWDGEVHAVAGDEAGLRWRTRSRFAVRDGGLAMLGRRSDTAVPIADCLIAEQAVMAAAAEAAAALPGDGEVLAVRDSSGQARSGPAAAMSRRIMVERVGQRRLAVAGDGFWQVHPGAPDALLGAVTAALPRAAGTLLDLYGGVGLFAGGLPGYRTVHLVEGDATAARLAAENLGHLANVRVHRSDVRRWLAEFPGPTDAVVLDPPRAGAGRAVLEEVHRLRPAAIAYVACDPAALARDLRILADLGWTVTGLRALDLFPMTHHVEAVAALRPASADLPP